MLIDFDDIINLWLIVRQNRKGEREGDHVQSQKDWVRWFVCMGSIVCGHMFLPPAPYHAPSGYGSLGERGQNISQIMMYTEEQ